MFKQSNNIAQNATISNFQRIQKFMTCHGCDFCWRLRGWKATERGEGSLKKIVTKYLKSEPRPKSQQVKFKIWNSQVHNTNQKSDPVLISKLQLGPSYFAILDSWFTSLSLWTKLFDAEFWKNWGVPSQTFKDWVWSK